MIRSWKDDRHILSRRPMGPRFPGPYTVTRLVALAILTLASLLLFGSCTATSLLQEVRVHVSKTTDNHPSDDSSAGDATTPPKFAITYEPNGASSGVVPVDEAMHDAGESVQVLGNIGDLSRDGFLFDGWNASKDGSGNTYSPGDSLIMPSADVTLFAHWVASFRITYVGNENDTGVAPQDGNDYEPGDVAEIRGNVGAPPLARVGYTFAGWSTNRNPEFGTEFVPGESHFLTGSLTLYAEWEARVSFEGNGATGGTMSEQTMFANETRNLKQNAFTRTGCTFDGWSTTPAGSEALYSDGAPFTMDSGDTILFARWASDASSWTQRSLMPVIFGQVAYGAGSFVAVSCNSSIAKVSSNGIDWMSTTLPTSAAWSSLTYQGGLFLVTASYSNKIAVSPDGAYWSLATLPSEEDWCSVAYGNGQFVAIASDTNHAAVSSNGMSWDPVTLPSSRNWQSINFGNGRFVVLPKGDNVTLTAVDGLHWTSNPQTNSLYTVASAYGSGFFVAVGINPNNAQGFVARSTDGVSWTPGLITGSLWSAITWGNGLYVTVAEMQSNKVAVSSDGLVWVIRTLPSQRDWIGIAYGNGMFVATTSDYIAATSP
ncbi:MAG TPA: InlB B-repeat-containing protein [Spirochaetia bacterium]|nr:InlB B-repeat-containing protein [Spirochaetia bacterium]